MEVWLSCLKGKLTVHPIVVFTNNGSSSLMVGVSEWGLKKCQKVQPEYNEHSWTPLKRHFVNPKKEN